MRAHVIDAGRVVNTIEVDSLDFMPGLVDASQGGRIGDDWDGTAFTTPPPVVVIPRSVSLRQAHEALIDAGLDTAIEDYIAAIANPGQRKKASNWYLRSQTFERNNRFLLSVVTALGWTDEQVDALFVAAASL